MIGGGFPEKDIIIRLSFPNPKIGKEVDCTQYAGLIIGYEDHYSNEREVKLDLKFSGFEGKLLFDLIDTFIKGVVVYAEN